MIKTYVICNIEREKDRYDNLKKQIFEYKLDNILDIEYFTFIWKDQITQEIRDKYCKTDVTMRKYGRNMGERPMTNGEISLFLNYIECLRKVKKENENSDSNFLIIESDTIFKEIFIEKINSTFKDIEKINDLDILNIGEGARYSMRGYPMTTPITIDGYKYHKENINSCAEAILWTYKGICKFLDYYEKDEDIDGPIDSKMDMLSTYYGNFNIYWIVPSLVYQGSVDGKIFQTSIR